MSVISSAKHLSKAGIGSLLKMVLKTECSVCDRSADSVFCADCQRQIKTECYTKQWQMDTSCAISVGALGAYRGTLKQAIRALKYENRPDVASILGAELGQRWLAHQRLDHQRSNHQHHLLQQHLPKRTAQPLRNSTRRDITRRDTSKRDMYVVPIPLHTNRLSQRGYNQAALIARSFCQTSRLPLIEHGLIRVQDTQPQHQLGIDERQENLKSAFGVGSALRRQQRLGRRLKILLIDDIYTTGTTTQSAAQVLIAEGMSVVGMLSVARAQND